MAVEEVTPAQERVTRAMIKAPCGFQVWNDVMCRDVTMYPAVNCNHNCEKCGWNPSVRDMRIAKAIAEHEARKKAGEL